MTNEIPDQQNQSEFIDMIAASSRAYGVVKTISRWQTSLASSAAIFGPAAAFLFPEASAWVALYSLGVLLVDVIFLEPAESSFQELGARIQEKFDTQLFGLRWNSHRCQSTPDIEVINSLASAFKRKESTKRLEDWYPVEVGNVPLDYGRLVCQRANMRWDAALRNRYANLFVYAVVAIPILGLAVALCLKWDASQIILSLVVPLLPASIKLIRGYRKQRMSAASSERSKAILESIWARAMSETVSSEDFAEESRRLQDELYDRRKASPIVPQIVYSFFREEFDRDMRFAAGRMIAEAKQRLGIESSDSQ